MALWAQVQSEDEVELLVALVPQMRTWFHNVSGHDGIHVKSQATWFLISWIVQFQQIDFLLSSSSHLQDDESGQLEEDIYIVLCEDAAVSQPYI